MKLKIQLQSMFVTMALLFALPAFAMAPGWMPGFPMRMGPSVMLMWTPVPGATAYNVYKSATEDSLGTVMASVPANNHMDMNVPLDQSAFYVVKPLVGGVEGEASQAGKIIGVKPLDAPKWVGHQQEEGKVALRFDGVTGAAFYNLFKSTSKDGPFNLVGSIQETKYTDSAVEEGKDYYYQVTAVDKNSVESPRSASYEYKFEKRVVTAAAKSWPQVDILVKNVDNFYGADDRALVQPSWLIAAGANLLVSDQNNVLIMNPEDGVISAEYVEPENYKGEWGMLRGIGWAADGTLLTTWFGFNGVRLFDGEGKVIAEWLVKKPTKEEYASYGREKDWEEDQKYDPVPRGICEDPQGRLWITEPIFRQIHIYERDGTLVKKIGEPRTRGFELKDVKSPSLIKYDPKNKRVYVLDPTVATVRAFDDATMDFIKDAKGEYIYGWKRGGAVPGGFQDPRGFDFLPNGDLIITDGIDGRIQVFNPDLDYVGQLVTKTGIAKPEKMKSPADVSVFGKKVYITEPLEQRVSVYELP